MLTEQRLGGGPDGVALLQLVHTAVGNPGALRGKTLHVILFLLQQALGNQQGHIHVLHALLFELLVHDVLDILPDGVAVGPVDENALDGRIINQLGLGAHVREPLGKVLLHIGNLLNLLLFCHFDHPLRFLPKVSSIIPPMSILCTPRGKDF